MFLPSPSGDPIELQFYPPFDLGSRSLAFVFALCLVAAVLALYVRYSRRLFAAVPRRIALLLLSLRLAALSILLVLCLFRPVFVRTSEIVSPARILFAVDLSASMAVADDGITSRAERVAATIDGRIADLSRGTDRTVDIVGFRSRIVPFSTADELVARLRDRASIVSGSADGTDLTQPLARDTGGSGPPTAIVLVGDGRHNRGASPVALAERLARRKIPVFTVDPTSERPPPDISIVSIAAPSFAFADSEVAIEAVVAIHQQPAGRIRVVLEREIDGAASELHTETIDSDGADLRRRITFRHRVGKLGSERLRVRVEPTIDSNGAKPRDIEPRNNVRALTIRVAPEKVKVVLIDAEPNWEFHYLHSLLRRDRSVEVSAIALEQPRLGSISPEDLKKAGYAALELPVDPDVIGLADVVILGDLSPEQLPIGQRERLAEFVADRGGTLIVRGGRKAMPLDWERIPTDDPFRKLLPIRLPRVVDSPGGAILRRTPEGLETPWLRLGSDPASDLETWNDLPRTYRAIAGVPTAGASVLATLEDGERPVGERPDGERPVGERPVGERPDGVLVRQNYGFGRVVWVGLDTTWRWRMKAGDTLHHRFWGQMIRWAAADRPAIASNDVVRFGPRESIVRADGEVRIVARIASGVRLADDAPVGLRILEPATATRPERTTRIVPLTAEPGRIGERSADVRGLPPGEYAAELTIPGLNSQTRGPDGKPLRCRWTVAADESEELADLSGNRPLLEELARVTGGTYLPLEKFDRLADLLPTSVVEGVTVSRVALREEGIVYLPLLLLLLAEWFLRRRLDLV